MQNFITVALIVSLGKVMAIIGMAVFKRRKSVLAKEVFWDGLGEYLTGCS